MRMQRGVTVSFVLVPKVGLWEHTFCGRMERSDMPAKGRLKDDCGGSQQTPLRFEGWVLARLTNQPPSTKQSFPAEMRTQSLTFGREGKESTPFLTSWGELLSFRQFWGSSWGIFRPSMGILTAPL